MSRVFVAEDTSLGRKIVVKVLPEDLAATVNVDRFQREIQLAAKLQHPHIVPVLSAGISEGLPYYTMPFIEGESLRARLARSGELPIPEVARILRDVLSALSYAHEHGVVHRDMKPDNVLLTGRHAVVADFGVAKAISAAATSSTSSITSVGIALGTPAYMAPEQAAADPSTDHRADLYSVGAMAYELLTGQPVFSARSPQAMLAAHAIETPEPIDKRRPSVPRPLASLVMRSLEKHAADRPQSADEMLAELDASITPSGATAPTGWSAAPRVEKSGRRQTLMALGLAAVLLALGSSSWYWYDRRAAALAPAVRDEIPSLAVLPFENLGETADAYFADGMTEEISSRLGTLSGLRVIGRQSAKSYANTTKPVAQIGTELGVAYLLTGTVRWDRSRPGRHVVKVSPALLRVSDGSQVWAEPYQDEVKAVFELQGKVAERVARALEVKLTEGQQQALGARPTESVEAYDYYLRAYTTGAGASNPLAYNRAISLYGRAIAADPRFAAAHAALGEAHLNLYWFRGDPSPRRLTLAKSSIDRALALDPKLSDAHLALGRYYYQGQLDYPRALEAFEAARRLAPNDPRPLSNQARIERRQGRWQDALAHMTTAAGLDPRNVNFLVDLCETQALTRSYAAAEQTCRRLVTFSPHGYPILVATVFGRTGDVQKVIALLDEARAEIGATNLVRALMSPELKMIWPSVLVPELRTTMETMATPAEISQRPGYFTARLMVAVYQNNTVSARQLADSVIRYVPRALSGNFLDSEHHAELALAYAAKGDKAKSREEGARAMEIVPFTRDAVRAAQNLNLIARAAALAGETDTAVSMLEQLVSVPSTVSRNMLRVDPWYDSLRQNPRFIALVSPR